MKKIGLILILLTLVGLEIKAQNQENKPVYSKSEIGFSIGAFPVVGLIVSPNEGWQSLESSPILKHAYYIKGKDGTYEKMYCLGSYTFNYNYHFNPKHSFGVSLSWIGKHIDIYEIYRSMDWSGTILCADTIDGSGWRHYFTLQGNYRNTYYQKNKISLYWGLYLGITLCTRDKNILPKETLYGISNARTYFSLAMHLNAFGIDIGEKYVFNMELGFGTQGLLKTGFKYKF